MVGEGGAIGSGYWMVRVTESDPSRYYYRFYVAYVCAYSRERAERVATGDFKGEPKWGLKVTVEDAREISREEWLAAQGR